MAVWLQQHRRSVLLLFLLLALGGVAAALRLPVALFPGIDFPRIVINVDAGDLPVDRMVVEVIQPLEQALRTVPEARAIRSKSTRGGADLSLGFSWGSDMVTALLQVQSVINQTLPDLPAGIRINARRMDPAVFPFLGLALTSESLNPVALRDLAYYRLRPVISTVAGVATVEVLGGQQAEYQVLVDPARLQAMDLGMSDVVQALSAANVLTAVGRLEDHYRLYLTLADSRLRSKDDISHTILRSGANGVIELEDVAEVRDGDAPQWTRVTAGGHDAVLINILQQRGANTVEIVREVNAVLAAFASQLPANTHITPYYDQSELVTAAAVSVRDAILLGALFAGVVLLLFLANLRMMLVIVLCLPGVLASAVLLLTILHQSFNIMTLGGMAAAVGLVVDDAVVMIEHIMRRVGERRDRASQHDTAFAAALEMARPLLGSSLATLVVFIPLAFISGVTGGFFKALAVTMSASLTISFFVALLVVPLLADLFLRRQRITETTGPVLRLMHRLYNGIMRVLLAYPIWAIAVLAVLSAAGDYAYTQIGSGFMPRMDEGGFILDYRAPPGTSLTETDRLLRQVEDIIRSTPEVDNYSRRTGLALGSFITEANEGDIFIHLRAPPRRGVAAIMADVRQAVETQVPGLRIETAQLMEDLIGDLTAVPQPIEIKLFGDDSAVLERLAPQVAEKIKSVAGVVEVFDGITIAGDAVEIRVDRTKAALEGLDAEAVARQVNGQFAGTLASHIQVAEKLIGVRVWTGERLRDRLALIARMQLRAADGHYLPVKRVAEIRVVEGQTQRVRENLKPMLAVTARIEGRDLGSTMGEVRAAVKSIDLPTGVYVEYGGLYQEQQRSFRDLAGVLLSAVLLVTVLLLFFYERFPIVLSILVTTLTSLSGVFIGLWITDTELNISSMMGMTMVVGMVTEVAIFYFAELRDSANHDDAALIRAGVVRMRPILMTSGIAVLALLPLALGIGAGSAMQAPLAISIISGLLLAVPLVLLVMPGFYSLMLRIAGKPATLGRVWRDADQ